MDYNKIEDAVLKKAMDAFKQSAVAYFGIGTKIIAPAETEIKNIDIRTNYTDYLFYTEDGNYLHFEFQTTDKKDDIKRFLYYDASLFYKEKRKIRTIVIYSADIEKVEEAVDAGTIYYKIEPFYMKKLNGDEKYKDLCNKIENNQMLLEEDILNLTFLPLMSGSDSSTERAIKGIELAEAIKDKEAKMLSLSLLYALFEKFGDALSKKRLKEVMTMTEIGKMIRDEALEEGKQEGKKEGLKEGGTKGKADILIKQLIKKFNKLPEAYKDNIKNLSEDTLEVIALNIFDLEKAEDLERYF